jgi:hypothetical protein
MLARGTDAVHADGPTRFGRPGRLTRAAREGRIVPRGIHREPQGVA